MTPVPSQSGASRVCLLGALRVIVGTKTITGTELGSRRGRSVLALLAVERYRVLTPDRIAETLWPTDRSPTVERNIASLISRLRGALGAELIVGGRRGYRLGEPPGVQVDLDMVAAELTESERRAANGQPSLVSAAVGRVMGDLAQTGALIDEPDADWAEPARAQQVALLRRARRLASWAALEMGDVSAARTAAEAALADDPLDEEGCRRLMTALMAAGEPGAALRSYERFRRRLADQLGTDPAEPTRTLHLEILRGGVGPTRIGPSGAVRQPDSLRLTGRDDEVEQLRRAWTQAIRAQGAIVLIAGEPGVGKTRLADHAGRMAADSGALLLTARCYEAERSLFLQPVVEALGWVALHRPAALVREAAGGHQDALVRLVPEMATILSEPGPDHGRSDMERRRAFEAVTAFLAALARPDPVLLILDDLQNAGRATVDLLHFMRREVIRSRLLIIATVRAQEGAAVLKELATVSSTIVLGPLSKAAVTELAAESGRLQQAEDIARRTGGHAQFVVEVLHSLAAGGDGLPDSLQSAILDRVRRAGPEAETILRAGAVLGASFDPLTAAGLAGISPAVALADCERALSARLLVVAGREYEFANDLIREAVYASIPTPTRLAYHRMAADLMSEHPEVVAVHAAAVSDRLRAGRSWLLAAEHAFRRFAARDAEALASQALEMADQLQDSELRGRALIIRGRSRDAIGSFDSAWQDLTSAVEAAQDAGDRRLEMMALREVAGDVSVALGHPPPRCEPPLHRILNIAGSLGDHVNEADALDRLTVLACARLQFVDARTLAAQARRAADASSDERALTLALDAQKTFLAYLGEVEALVGVTDKLEPMLRRAGNLWALQWTVFESALVPLAAEDYAHASQRMTEALTVNERSGYAVQTPWYVAHLGWVARLSGDLDRALEFGAESVEAGRAHGGHYWWQSTAASLYACTLMQAGRGSQARELLQKMLPEVETAGAQAYRLRILGPLAEVTESVEVLAEADALLRQVSAPVGCAWLLGADAYLGIARAWRAQGDPARAAAVLEPFVQAANRAGWPALVRLAAPLT